MEFSNELFPKVVELTLILVSYITGPDGHIDLDRFSQAEAISDLFHAVLSTCGDCPFLANVKFLWKAVSTALATIEGETTDGNILTNTQITHEGPLRSLNALNHVSFQYLRPLLDESMLGLHEIHAHLRAQALPADMLLRCQDVLLICEMLCTVLQHPTTPRRPNALEERLQP